MCPLPWLSIAEARRKNHSPVYLRVIISDLVVSVSARVFIDFRCHFGMERSQQQGRTGPIVEEKQTMKRRRKISHSTGALRRYNGLSVLLSLSVLLRCQCLLRSPLPHARTIGLCLLRYQTDGGGGNGRTKRWESVRLAAASGLLSLIGKKRLFW